jgi:hypothetical protein
MLFYYSRNLNTATLFQTKEKRHITPLLTKFLLIEERNIEPSGCIRAPTKLLPYSGSNEHTNHSSNFTQYQLAKTASKHLSRILHSLPNSTIPLFLLRTGDNSSSSQSSLTHAQLQDRPHIQYPSSMAEKRKSYDSTLGNGAQRAGDITTYYSWVQIADHTYICTIGKVRHEKLIRTSKDLCGEGK